MDYSLVQERMYMFNATVFGVERLVRHMSELCVFAQLTRLTGRSWTSCCSF